MSAGDLTVVIVDLIIVAASLIYVAALLMLGHAERRAPEPDLSEGEWSQ